MFADYKPTSSHALSGAAIAHVASRPVLQQLLELPQDGVFRVVKSLIADEQTFTQFRDIAQTANESIVTIRKQLEHLR